MTQIEDASSGVLAFILNLVTAWIFHDFVNGKYALALGKSAVVIAVIVATPMVMPSSEDKAPDHTNVVAAHHTSHRSPQRSASSDSEKTRTEELNNSQVRDPH